MHSFQVNERPCRVAWLTVNAVLARTMSLGMGPPPLPLPRFSLDAYWHVARAREPGLRRVVALLREVTTPLRSGPDGPPPVLHDPLARRKGTL